MQHSRFWRFVMLQIKCYHLQITSDFLKIYNHLWQELTVDYLANYAFKITWHFMLMILSVVFNTLMFFPDFLSPTMTFTRVRSAGQQEAAYWVEAEFSTGHPHRLEAPPANESSSNALFARPFYLKYERTPSLTNLTRAIVLNMHCLFW